MNPQVIRERKNKIRSSINELIQSKNKEIIERLEKENDCFHVWKESVSGYVCTGCGHRTGRDPELNDLVNRLGRVAPE